MYDGEVRVCEPVKGASLALPRARASVLCEVAALDEDDPAEPLCIYHEDYFIGAPAAAVHPYGKGHAYYLASRFDEGFYREFYRAVCRRAALAPAWPDALPQGVLSVRRGEHVFLQNCNDVPVEVDGTILAAYETVVR